MSRFLRAFTICAVTVQVALAAPATSSISKTGRCGASFGSLTCKGSSYGNCCSSYSFCGSSSAYCGDGCQSGYGTCSGSTSPPPSTPQISTDGQCGSGSGSTCLGSKFGNCCSKHGWCGRSEAYCGQGCNPLYGTCTSNGPSPTRSSSIPSQSSVSAIPSPSSPSQLVVTTNARCGNAYEAFPKGMTCLGSKKYGSCCSQYSYCGSGESYCGKGCQPEFGNCNARPSSVSSSRVSSSKSSTIGISPTPSTPSISSPASTPTVSSSSSVIIVPSSSSSAISSSSSMIVVLSSSTPVPSSSSSVLIMPSSSSTPLPSSLSDAPSSSASSVTLPSSTPGVQSSIASSSIASSSSELLSSSNVASPTPTPTPTPEDPSSSLVSSSAASSTPLSSSEIASSSSVPSPVVSSSIAVSSADSSSSIVASSTTPSTPTPAIVLRDGDFEATVAADVPWVVKLGGVRYNFMTPATVTTPFSGSQVGSITYGDNSSPFVGMFGQNINLVAGTTYNLSARFKSSRANTNCALSFAIGQATGVTLVAYIVTLPASSITTEWQETIGSYVHGAVDQTLSFNIRTTCTGTIPVGFSYYVDAITFTPS